MEWIPSSHHAGLWTTNFFLSFPQFERNKNNNMSAGFTIKAMDFGTPYSKPSHERAWYTLFVHAGTGFSHFSNDWSSMGWAGLRQISAVCIILLYQALIWVRPGCEATHTILSKRKVPMSIIDLSHRERILAHCYSLFYSLVNTSAWKQNLAQVLACSPCWKKNAMC